MEPRTIVESRLKTLGGLAFFFALLGLCVLGVIPSHDGRKWMWWLSVAFAALGIPLHLWLLFRPMVLKLDGEGFELSGGLYLQPKRVAWRDIDRFVLGVTRTGSIIQYTYRIGRAPARRWARLIGFGQAPGSFPLGWPISAPELSQLLNDYCWDANHGNRRLHPGSSAKLS